MKVNKMYVVFLMMLLFLSGCEKHNDQPINLRTLIFYMLPDNNLARFMEQNIADVKTGFDGVGEILIYKDKLDTPPVLYQLVKKKDNTGKYSWSEVVVNEYAEFDGLGHIPENMRWILSNICDRYTAESYGLILSSHGTGWIPPTIQSTRSFGPTKEQQMSVQDIAAGIPDGLFEFILFDACFMASSEVAYELRGKASWLIASATEIAGTGLPYDKLINNIMKMNNLQDYKNLCDDYVVHYQEGMGGTLSIINLFEIENLHMKLSALLMQSSSISPTLFTRVQQFGDTYTASRKDMFFDLQHFVQLLMNDNVPVSFQEAYYRCVVYSNTTPGFLDITLPNNNGLSFYLPNPTGRDYHETYRVLGWAQQLEWQNLLN